MKIVHVTYGFQLGGIETMLRNIANEQAGLGHDVSIMVINDIVNSELRDSLDDRIRFICLERKVGSKSLVHILKMNRIIHVIKPDIVHLHYSSISRFLVDPLHKLNVCVTLHAMCTKQNSEYLYKTRHIYAISNVVKEDIKRCTGLNSETVYNGVKAELIKTKKGNRQNKEFKIVQVSRLVHTIKGQHILVKAVSELVGKGYKNITLDLIGGGESLEYLSDMVKELKIEKHVRFLGAQSQSYIFEHLCEYDLFVQASIYEGFGLTVAEAMAAKVPVLVSQTDGPMEVIDYGKYGYYFKNGDVEDCAAKIELFINGRNDANITEAAYMRVSEVFDVKATAANYIRKYNEIVAHDRKQS